MIFMRKFAYVKIWFFFHRTKYKQEIFFDAISYLDLYARWQAGVDYA
jgi:hypothetical protein